MKDCDINTLTHAHSALYSTAQLTFVYSRSFTFRVLELRAHTHTHVFLRFEFCLHPWGLQTSTGTSKAEQANNLHEYYN